MENTLGDGLAAAADRDGALRGVGQHLRGHLDGGARHLADLLDLGPALADERPALRRGHHQAEGDGRARDGRGGHQVGKVLEKESFEGRLN